MFEEAKNVYGSFFVELAKSFSMKFSGFPFTDLGALVNYILSSDSLEFSVDENALFDILESEA